MLGDLRTDIRVHPILGFFSPADRRTSNLMKDNELALETKIIVSRRFHKGHAAVAHNYCSKGISSQRPMITPLN